MSHRSPHYLKSQGYPDRAQRKRAVGSHDAAERDPDRLACFQANWPPLAAAAAHSVAVSTLTQARQKLAGSDCDAEDASSWSIVDAFAPEMPCCPWPSRCGQLRRRCSSGQASEAASPPGQQTGPPRSGLLGAAAAGPSSSWELALAPASWG